MRFISLAIIIICTATIPTRAEDKPFPDAIPTTFSFWIGGMSGATSVNLVDGNLKIQFPQMGKKASAKLITVRPTKESWTRFVKEINSAKLYRWSPEYTNQDVCDGTQWFINIEINSRKMKSSGSNNYPISGEEAKPTNSIEESAPFVRVVKAISELTGREINSHAPSS